MSVLPSLLSWPPLLSGGYRERGKARLVDAPKRRGSCPHRTARALGDRAPSLGSDHAVPNSSSPE
jgi:hypothetical protein